LDDDSTRLWHSRVGHVGLNSLQALVMQGLLKRAKTYNLESCEHCVLGKKTKVKFDTVIHRMEGVLDFVHMDIWELTKTASFGGHLYFISFIDNLFRHCGVYTL